MKTVGNIKYTRMPAYGLAASPRNRVGNRKNQKTVAVVTITTPRRLIQLFDRCTTGDSQLRGGEPGERIIVW